MVAQISQHFDWSTQIAQRFHELYLNGNTPNCDQIRKRIPFWYDFCDKIGIAELTPLNSLTFSHHLQRNDTVIKAETALMYDAVHLFAKALHDLDTSQQIDIQPLSCDGQDTWPHGYSLINYMKIV